MNVPWKHSLRAGLSVLVSTLLTWFFIWMLALLNTHATPTVPEQLAIGTFIIQGPESDASASSEPPPPTRPEPPTPEVMTVNLDLPTPDLPELEPLDLDLALETPSLSPLQISIQRSPNANPVSAAAASRSTSQNALSAPRRADSVDRPPGEATANVRPAYPEALRQRGIEGRVLMKLLIGESGRVEDVEILEGLEAFRQSVMSVAFQWRFTPAMHQGHAVRVWGLKVVTFRMRNP